MLPVSVWTFIGGAVLGVSVSWYVATNNAVKRELELLQKQEDARQEEKKRNAEIAQKHASDLYQVTDYYQRHPVTVRVPQVVSCPGNPTGDTNVKAEDLVLVVGGAKGDNGETVDGRRAP